MATPRRHWFRVADSVLTEPWSNDVLATFTRLSAYLHTRWARDGRTASDAGSVVVPPSMAEQLAGCRSLTRARRVIRELATHVSLAVHEQGTNTVISWPKWSVFQQLPPGIRAEAEAVASQELPLPLPPPPPPPQEEEKLLTSLTPAPPAPAAEPAAPVRAKRTRAQRLPAPEGLAPREVEALARWVRDGLRRPDLLGRLPALIDACLTHHRAKGNAMASWYAAVQTWIRNEAEGRFGTPRRPAGNAPAPTGSRAERRERAQALYSLEQLLPEPTEDALSRWEAAGSPRERGWWLPPDERPQHLRVVS